MRAGLAASVDARRGMSHVQTEQGCREALPRGIRCLFSDPSHFTMTVTFGLVDDSTVSLPP
ncbi:hypothetical protein GCM10025774_21270 [Microbacterium kyungheense]